MTIESGDTISLQVLQQFIDIEAEESASDEEEDGYAGALARFETEYLRGLLLRTGGNVEAAAREAGMNMATIYRKLKKYEIRKEDYS